MVNEPYPIGNADGKLFCLCQNTAAGPVLMTKNCKMPMDEFLSKAYGKQEEKSLDRGKHADKRKHA